MVGLAGRGARNFAKGIYQSARLDAQINPPEKRNGTFTMRFSPHLGLTMGAVGVVTTGIGIFLYCIAETTIATIFFVLGLILLLLAVFCLLWRCDISDSVIRERYFGLFGKSIPWKAVKNAQMKRDQTDSSRTLILYGEKRRLISFSEEMLGFHKLLKMVRQKGVALSKHKPKRSR